MDDLSIRALSVTASVASHRSFRAAAQELEMSPSSVSHIVANLERRLGIRLFLRNTRSVSLTEAGEAFLGRVRPALSEITQAIEGVNDLRDHPVGLVRLNGTTWGADRILPIVMGFMREFPDVRVDLVTEGRLIDIIAEGFDAGLRQESVVPQDMIAIPVGILERLLIVASPDYLATRGTPQTPGDLLAHECIRARLPSGTIMRWELGKGGAVPEIEVAGRLIVGTTDLAAKAAAAGAGLAYVEQREAQTFIDRGELVQVLAEWTPPYDSEALYYPPQRLSSAAFRAFVGYFRNWTTTREQACAAYAPNER